ncbi:hypothetical protein CIHG_07826 [Coccidioides immitis H538.4]|uniref:Uncharacterized protein n=1 Tax=Coccidioides immitis H538.4 TaxID=396776 RepID=A0A0J8UQG7_COCIT|nr:hypothetical protein CIHG_07826 [Coccidioides immitis H538.4]
MDHSGHGDMDMGHDQCSMNPIIPDQRRGHSADICTTDAIYMVNEEPVPGLPPVARYRSRLIALFSCRCHTPDCGI